MNSRERVLKTLNHEEPDRVPFDLGGTVTTGIHHIAYSNLLDYLGYDDKEAEIGEIIQQLAAIDEEILRELNVDVRPLFCGLPEDWELEIKENDDYTKFTDQWGIEWKKPKKNGLYYDLSSSPFSDMKTPEEVKKYEFPDPRDPNRFLGVEEKVQSLKEDSSAAIALAGISAGFLEMAYWLRGYEQFFEDFISNQAMAEAILDKTVNNKIEFWQEALNRFGDKVDIVVEADDFASQRGMIISPETYRKFIKPRQKRLFQAIKDVDEDVYIFFHSCGAVYEIIPDLIEAGVDALNPVQISAKNMDAYKLKEEFGDEITFWGGGVNTQEILNKKSPKEVKENVKRRIDTLAPGGGFVFAAVHNIQADVPPENIMAMWETWKEYGKY